MPRLLPARRTLGRCALLAPVAAAALNLWFPFDVHAVTTTFTNANNNLLWSDPANWTNGVPGAADVAVFANPLGSPSVDLGGAARSASQVEFNTAGYTLANGTLTVPTIRGTATGTIAANLTSPTGTLTLQGSGAGIPQRLTVAGEISGNIAVEGAGTLAGANSYTGRTRADGTLTLTGLGSAASSSNFFVNGTKLSLDYTPAGGAIDKVGNNATITLWRSELVLTNSTGGAVNETVGTITLLKSANTIRIAPQTTLTTPGFIRDNFATALLDFDPATGAQLRLAASAGASPGQLAGDTSHFIFPWLMGAIPASPGSSSRALSFITFTDDGFGLRPLDLATEYATSIGIGSPFADTRLTNTQTITGSRTVRSLALHDANAGVQLDNAFFSITNGALAFSTDSPSATDIPSITGTGTLQSSATELVAWTDIDATNVNRYRIDVPIIAATMTKSGPGALVLSQPNNMGGRVVVNDGTLVSAGVGALGRPNDLIAINRNAAIRFESVSQNYGTIQLDNVVTETSGTSTRSTGGPVWIDVAPGIVATIDHINGTSGFNKVGAGRLRIASDSTILGPAASMFLVGGSMQVDGTFTITHSPAPSLPTVFGNLDSTLLGTGTVIANVSANIAPGVDDIGRLAVSTLGFGGAGLDIRIELAGTDAGTSYDQLVVLNAANLNFRDLDVDLLNGFTPALGTQFTVLDKLSNGAITGTFTGLAQDAVFFADGQAFQISYTGGTGNDVVLTAVVPEPTTTFAGLLASGALIGARQRRSRAGGRRRKN